MKKISSVLTILGNDRPGIIAAVTETLFREGCNLEDISMTVLEGELAMMMIVSLEDQRSKSRVDTILCDLHKKDLLDFAWKDLKQKSNERQSQKKKTKIFLISAIGRDRTGIVYKISRILANFKINITDLNSKILGRSAKPLYAMVLEADIPRAFKISKLEKAFKRLSRRLQIEITVRPFERIEF